MSSDIQWPGVSDSKSSELLMATSQLAKRYENILASLPVVVGKLSLDRKSLIYINQACETITGYTQTELFADIGLFFRSIHPDDIDQFNANFDLLQSQENAPFNIRFFHKDGGIRELSGAMNLLRNPEGTVYSYSGYIIDVTQQRIAERGFHEKAEEIKDLLESITDAFFAADKNWRITYANKAAEKLYKVRREEIINKSVSEVFPKVPGSTFFDGYEKVVREKIPVTTEGISPTSGRWVQSFAYPTSKGMAVLFKDVTEQRKLVEEVNRNAQNLYALINNTQDFIWSVDCELNLLYINESCRNATKAEFGILLAQGTHMLQAAFGTAFIADRKSHYTRALAGEAFMVTDEQQVKDGMLYRETSFTPITDNSGNVIGVSCFSRNITDQKKQLLEIQKQNARMKEIAWIQSHKIRSPLATILGLAGLLNLDNTTSPENEMLIKGIVEKALELDSMVKEIVNITESGNWN